MKKAVLITLCIALGAFLLSLVVYFFNLDMKFAAAAQPILNKWYDRRKRAPMP